MLQRRVFLKKVRNKLKANNKNYVTKKRFFKESTEEIKSQ